MPTPPLGNKRLANFGTDAEKLYNDRYRISRRWLIADENKIPSNDELQANYFEEFSTEDLTPYGDDPADIPEGYRFDDCVLVRQYTTFPPGLGFQLFVKEYETVTNTFTDTEPASKRVTDSGLSVYSQPQIGSLAAPVTGEVGVTTKVFDGVTHSLAGYNEVKTGPASKEIELQWAEAGVLSIFKQNISEGVKEVTTVFLVTEGTTVGPIIRKRTDNFEGLKTISVTTLQDGDGNPINDQGENLVNQYQRHVSFTYPGVVGVKTATAASGFGDQNSNSFYYQRSPVQSLVKATVYVLFTDSQNIGSSDYTYDNSIGLWNPTEWAQGDHAGWSYIRDNFGGPIGDGPGFRGCRIAESAEINGVTPSVTGTAGDDNGLLGRLLLFGSEFNIGVSGGPSNPDGKKYTLDIQVAPAFEDIDGNIVYKKTIVVATIPTQGSTTLT